MFDPTRWPIVAPTAPGRSRNTWALSAQATQKIAQTGRPMRDAQFPEHPARPELRQAFGKNGRAGPGMAGCNWTDVSYRTIALYLRSR